MASFKEDPEEAGNPLAEWEAPEGLSPVAVFQSGPAAHDAGLAILAMGRPYWTLIDGERFVLCVRAGDRELVRKELDELARLGGSARPTGDLFAEHALGAASFVLFAVLLVSLFAAQAPLDLVPTGRADSIAMIEQGQWWRTVTAMTLHGDVVHLVSNLVAGAGFAFFVARFFGVGVGWLLVVLSGLAGNALNAWVAYPDAHYSIGASTAVFGAVGLLTGIGIWASLREPRMRLSLPRWMIPLLGGLTLLGWLGVGDERTDVAAHISGFLCGTVFGLIGAFGQKWIARLEGAGFWLRGLPLLIVAVAWFFAFRAS